MVKNSVAFLQKLFFGTLVVLISQNHRTNGPSTSSTTSTLFAAAQATRTLPLPQVSIYLLCPRFFEEGKNTTNSGEGAQMDSEFFTNEMKDYYAQVVLKDEVAADAVAYLGLTAISKTDDCANLNGLQIRFLSNGFVDLDNSVSSNITTTEELQALVTASNLEDYFGKLCDESFSIFDVSIDEPNPNPPTSFDDEEEDGSLFRIPSQEYLASEFCDLTPKQARRTTAVIVAIGVVALIIACCLLSFIFRTLTCGCCCSRNSK